MVAYTVETQQPAERYAWTKKPCKLDDDAKISDEQFDDAWDDETERNFFNHLHERRAGEVWEMLSNIAEAMLAKQDDVRTEDIGGAYADRAVIGTLGKCSLRNRDYT